MSDSFELQLNLESTICSGNKTDTDEGPQYQTRYVRLWTTRFDWDDAEWRHNVPRSHATFLEKIAPKCNILDHEQWHNLGWDRDFWFCRTQVSLIVGDGPDRYRMHDIDQTRWPLIVKAVSSFAPVGGYISIHVQRRYTPRKDDMQPGLRDLSFETESNTISTPVKLELDVVYSVERHSFAHHDELPYTYNVDLNLFSNSGGYQQFELGLVTCCHQIDEADFAKLGFEPDDFQHQEQETYIVWDNQSMEELTKSAWNSMLSRLRNREYTSVSIYQKWTYTPLAHKAERSLRVDSA